MKSLNLDRIQTRMEELGLNQSSLSEKLSISRESVSKWFKKESFPRPVYLLSLAKTLGLSFSEITLADSSPVGTFAYRTNLNHKVDKKRIEIAEDMLASLESLKPYLDEQPLFGVAPLARPVIEYGYIQRAAKDLRVSLGFGESGIVDEQALILFFRQHGTIFIPVLWGEKGDNALHVCLADGVTHFIYINLEKKLSDFKFWLVHELSHIITLKTISEQEAETFADMFAMAFLYPEHCAKRLYARIHPKEDVGYKINCIIEEASAFAISPVTVFKQLNAWASANDKPLLQFDLYGATQNYTKTVKLVSEVLFEEDHPAVEKYITVSKQVFGDTFWNALVDFMVKERKSHSYIQRILNIPIADAKGVWHNLTTTKNPA